MQKSCTHCPAPFEVTDDDLTFYGKVSPVIREQRYPIPPPTLCSDCRLQRKVCFRNERVFYKRKSDLSGKEILSIYSPASQCRVYDQGEWWSDKWDPRDYGRDVDFGRPFFEQMRDLWKEVPLIALWNFNCENATYNNNCFNLKNSYMNYNCDEGERVFYSYVTEFCNDSADCAFVHKSELCYQCIDCMHAYHCTHSQMLENCSDCHFCSDLIGCSKCFGCHGLRQQSCCMFNEKLTEQEWNERMKAFVFTAESIQEAQERSEAMRLRTPQVATKQVQCEHCTGNFLYSCKDCTNCFDAHGGEHMKNVIYVPWNAKYIQDAYAHAGSEWAYEVLAGGVGVFHVAFINGMVNGLSDSYYCCQCGNSSEHLFGCISMMKRHHCILNKQYTKEQYEELVPKVIEHMQRTGEWGEFMPPSISPFCYNETMAQEFFPLKKEDAIAGGYTWRDTAEEPLQGTKVIPAEKLPASIDDIPDDILNWSIRCTVTGRLFKIVPQELTFYRRMKLPIPHVHYEERYQQRMRRRLPRKLWKRSCMKCEREMLTSYQPTRPELVYCESCYLAAVY